MNRIRRTNEISPLWSDYAYAFAGASAEMERLFSRNIYDPYNTEIGMECNNARIMCAIQMMSITNPELVTKLSQREMLEHAEAEIEREIGKIFHIARSPVSGLYGS